MRTRFLAASLAAFAASVPLAVAAPLAASARQDVPAPPPVVTPCANAVSTNSGVVMRGANLVSANFKVTNCSTVDEVVYPKLIDLGFVYGDATQTPCATGDYPFGQPGPVTIKAGSSWTYKTLVPWACAPQSELGRVDMVVLDAPGGVRVGGSSRAVFGWTTPTKP